MNKKGKEGGSTWFNRRQTEIPLFKINKKKKKQTGRVWGSGGRAGGPRKFLFPRVLAGAWGRAGATGVPAWCAAWGGAREQQVGRPTPRRAPLPRPAASPCALCARVSAARDHAQEEGGGLGGAEFGQRHCARGASEARRPRGQEARAARALQQ